MKQTEITTLKKKLEKQREILYACKDTFNDILYLQGKDVDNDGEKYFLDEPVLRYVQHLMWSYLILELCKLYSQNDNDSYRVFGVLNILKNKYKNLPFRDKFSKENINNFITELSGENFNSHFVKLNNIRDKYVAHLDANLADIQIENTDIEYFFELTDRIFKQIFDHITDNAIYLGAPSTLKNFIRTLTMYKGVYDKLENAIDSRDIEAATERDLLRILKKRNFAVEGIG